MTDADLNRRCAELAGLCPCLPAVGTGFICHACGKSMEWRFREQWFTSSLDACRKWLWPVVEEKGLKEAYATAIDEAIHGAESRSGMIDYLDLYHDLTAPPEAHARAFIACMEAK